jgi:hypothetical protein
MPGHLHAAVVPTPQDSTQRAYTVTVTNADTGTPVNQASVTLHNFTTTGKVQTVGPLPTDASGAVTFNVALRPKITYQVDPIEHDRTRVFVPPTLTVSKAGFDTISLTLLEDPGDV